MTPEERLDLRRWSAKLMGFRMAAQNIMGMQVWGGGYADYIFKDGTRIAVQDWHPDEDANQCFMVVERMRELGFNFNLNWQGHPGITVVIAQFHKFDTGVMEHGQGSDDNGDFRLAILLAAKATGLEAVAKEG